MSTLNHVVAAQLLHMGALIFDAEASRLTLHPPPGAVAAVGDKVTLFVHADPRLHGSVRLTTVDAAGAVQGAPTSAAFERGSAVFTDVDAYTRTGPAWLRAESPPRGVPLFFYLFFPHLKPAP